MSTTATQTTSAPLLDRADQRRALVGSAVGSAIEWYDFFLYGTMASLVFGNLFFPSDNPTSSLLLALASYALAFFIRPVGGIIFSHIGDRIGRKRTLVITLVAMGLSTALIGVLPVYATIGIAAPIILTLIRLVQGIAAGGEWGGGALLAVEYAPPARRGLFAGIAQSGILLGLALGNLASTGANSLFPGAAFESFGWRIPFLLSLVLVAIGLWIRHRIGETPSFQRVLDSEARVRVPLFTTLKYHWRSVLIAIGAKVIETSTFFLFATFIVTYAVALGFDRGLALNAVLVASVVAIPMMALVGRLSDSVGRKRVFLIGTVVVIVLAIPIFWLMTLGSPALLVIAVVGSFGIVWPLYGSTLGAFFAESFPAKVRYTGISLGYQVGAAITGGPAPLIAVALMGAFGTSFLPLGIMVIVAGAISLIAVAFAKDRTGQPLD